MRGVAFVVMALTACNSGSDCATASAALCQRAVACAEGGVPRFVVGTGDVAFPTEPQCEAAYNVGCASNADAGTVDFNACTQAAPSASCATDLNGGGVVVPSACLQ